MKHPYPSWDQILLHHRLLKLPFSQSTRVWGKQCALDSLVHTSFRWLRAFWKANSGSVLVDASWKSVLNPNMSLKASCLILPWNLFANIPWSLKHAKKELGQHLAIPTLRRRGSKMLKISACLMPGNWKKKTGFTDHFSDLNLESFFFY